GNRRAYPIVGTGIDAVTRLHLDNASSSDGQGPVTSAPLLLGGCGEGRNIKRKLCANRAFLIFIAAGHLRAFRNEALQIAGKSGGLTSAVSRACFSAIWSFVHIDDAVAATVASLTVEPGVCCDSH